MSVALTQAREAYIALYVADVCNHPDAYKQRVRDDASAAACAILKGLDLREVRQLYADLNQEIAKVQRATK